MHTAEPHKHKDLHDFSYQVSGEPFAFPRRAATAWLPDRAPIDYTVSTSPADAQLARDCCANIQVCKS